MFNCVMQNYFLIAGIGSLFYYLLIHRYTGRWNSTFSTVWLFAGCIHLGFCFAYPHMPGPVCSVIDGLVLCVWLSFLILESRILCTAQRAKNFSEDVDYLIILGAQVRGEKITDSLKRRLDRAYLYLCRHPETIVIVSGGQGKDEAVTEAFAMAKYLKTLGIDSERIIREEQSSTTWENLKFSAELIGSFCEKTAVVTNDFHLYRALLIGKNLGYTKLYGMAATSNPVLKLNYMTREFAAVLLTKVKSML